MERLTKFYRLIIIETDNENGFYAAVGDTGAGYGKINTLIIGGHGSPTSMELGYHFDSVRHIRTFDEDVLDLTDEEDIEKLQLRQFMADNSKIILVSCFTGFDKTSIGSMIANLFGANVLYAPRYSSSKTNYTLSPEGEIQNVTYDVDTSLFKEGKLSTVPERRNDK